MAGTGKWPYNKSHMSYMYHVLQNLQHKARGQRGLLASLITEWNQKQRHFFLQASKSLEQRTMRACLLSSFIKICSTVTEEKQHMSQPIRSQGNHLCWWIGPKNSNFEEDIDYFIPVNICQKSFQRLQRSGQCLSQSEAKGPSLLTKGDKSTKAWWRMSSFYLL